MHCGEDDADYLNNPELGVKRQGLHVLWQGPAEKPRLQGFKGFNPCVTLTSTHNLDLIPLFYQDYSRIHSRVNLTLRVRWLLLGGDKKLVALQVPAHGCICLKLYTHH